MFKDLFKVWVLCLSCVSILAACDSDQAKSNKARGKLQNQKPLISIPVAVQKPLVGTAISYYESTVALEPSSDASITARTTGVVREILHEEGDDVEAGAVLLRLEDDDQRLRLLQAKQNLEKAEREYARVKKMRASGVVASNDYDTAEIAYKNAKTELELAELALRHTQIVAPFTGRVVQRSVDLGTTVAAGAVVFRMMAIDPLLARVHVPASRIGQVAVKDKVDLYVDSINKTLSGEVDLVSPIVDPDTGTIKVTIAISEYPDQVRPGDFAKVKLITHSRKNALLIPSNAIIEERGQHFVYIARNNKAHKTQVEVGYVNGNMTEITHGIDADNLVVVKGQRGLSDQMAIKIKNEPGREAQARNAFKASRTNHANG